MKAIHNWKDGNTPEDAVVSDQDKELNESNSQPKEDIESLKAGCVRPR